MEVKSSLKNKISFTQNINLSNRNSVNNSKKYIEIKSPHQFSNFPDKVKGISSFYQKIHQLNQPMTNKPEEINKKDLLIKNLFVNTLSYKKTETNPNKNNNSNNISINNKNKKKLFESKQKDDMNKDLSINFYNHINSNYNNKNNNNNNNKYINKEKNLTDRNNTEEINKNINYNTNHDNNIIIYKNFNHRNDLSNYNKNAIFSNNKVRNIISMLNSKNKLYKRNNIQNLKNININNNLQNSKNPNNNINKNNYASLITLSNSNLNSNCIKNKSKANELNLSNHIKSIIINTNPNSISKNNINTYNMTKENYINKNNNHKSITNKNILKNNIRNDIFKNSKSQIFNKNEINEKENNNLNHNNHYYINTSTSNISKYIDKIKKEPSMKIIIDDNIKNIVFDKKSNNIFLKGNKTDRGMNNKKELTSKEKVNNTIGNHDNFQEIKSIYSKKQLSEFNINRKQQMLEENNNPINNMKYINNKSNLNINAKKNKNKNSIKSKMLLLNNSSIFSPIIKVKNKGFHKHVASMGTFTNRFNKVNIESNIKIKLLNNSKKILNNKINSDYISNNSFPKKKYFKQNYLNINLNSLSNINNTNANTIANSHSINTIPTYFNTKSDNSINVKQKLRHKFLQKKSTSYNNKSLINSTNNIIILNNISMNNLNTISFDYLSKITKKFSQNNSNKTISSIKRQTYNYVSKEKNIFDNQKKEEKYREYYNNQKKLHKKKTNYKQNNRIKEQNLNSFILKHSNNILKNNKNNESTNLIINNYFKNKNKKNNIVHNHTNSNQDIYNHNKKIASNEFNYIHNFAQSLNFTINHNNKIVNKMNTTNPKAINQIIKSLKGIKNNKEKSLKINSAQISPKKNYNFQIKQLSKDKDGKSNNQENLNMNNKKSLVNSITVQKLKDNIGNNKKEIILRNSDNNESKVNIVNTEYDNKMKFMKNKINLNYINDINEVSIEATKNNKENKIDDISYINKTIKSNSNKMSKKIKIIKNKYLRPHSQDIPKKKDSDKDKIKESKEDIEKDIEIDKNEDKDKIEPPISTIEPNNIINKDTDPQLGKEYLIDIIESLLIEEDYFMNNKKYINPFYLENEKSELSPEMRTVAVDWLVLVHHKIFKFKENTLFLAIQIFDRYLSKNDLNTEKTELLLITSFMLASKYNEIDYVNMKETLQLSQNKFTKEQVIEMEFDILSKLDFEVYVPTMCEYFTLFASYLNLSESKINHGFYILNIVLVDFHMLEHPNFMLALAVVKLITKKIDKNLVNLIKKILKEHKFDNFLKIIEEEENEEIFELCNKIKLLYDTFLETKYKNIQDKFSESKYNCVSNYTNI